MADDPLLTARPPGPRLATRIVLDSRGRIPVTAQLVSSARAAPTMIVASVDAPAAALDHLRQAGCEVLALPLLSSEWPEVPALLDELGRRRFTNLLVEGGAEVLGSFLAAGAIDEVHVFLAPRLVGGKDAKTGYDLTGDYYGLPWPCYGTAAIKHPGTPNLYDTSKHSMDGGHTFRALFGVERDGVNLLAEDGVYSKGSDITTGYPQFDHVLLKKLGWWDELTDEEKKLAEGKTWANDMSGGIIRVAMKHGCTAFGNAKARAVVWNFPDPIPIHREPLFSPRPDMVEKYPTHDDVKVFWRLPTLFKSVQQQALKDEVHKKFPLILTSGRLVEYEGGGEETRSNPWLAELQQDNFVEINPKTAADRGIRNGEYVWVSTPAKNPGGGNVRIKVKAKVTEGVGPDTVFIPFHFSGWWQGEDMLPYYPEGAAPIVRGEAVNTATTYGYDRVTMMQETKTTLCQVAKA